MAELMLNNRLILFVAVASAWIAAAAHAEPVKRTRYPALSPDGKTIAFSYQGDIWSVPADGGRATRLTTHPARDLQPLFTPDGKSIVFSSNRYGNYDLFVMAADGGPARRLTFNSGNEFASSVTPDGKWVLFYGTAYGASDIYKVPLAGGEPVRLTWDRHERKYFGSVSPDGQWIAYNHNGSPGSWRRRGYEGSFNADVWLARFTTPISEPRRLTTNPGQDFTPMFSRDGKRLYYVSDRKGDVNLWSMDLQGGSQKQLTFHKTDGVRVPSYAPRGEKIAYEWNSEIWLLDVRSGKTGQVKIDVTTDERRNPVIQRTLNKDPSEYEVSPDGKKVALVVHGELFVVPAAGGPARRLVGRPGRQSRIAWMPDSRTILFDTDEKGQQDLHSVEISGQNEKTLADSAADETNAQPSPDGKYIAYHRGDHELVIIPAAGGDPVATIKGDFMDVTRDYSPRFSWSPDSNWLVFDETGSRLEDAIYVASVTDAQPNRVTQFFRGTSVPRFSPNGKMIYFVGAAVDTENLYAVDLADEEKPTFEEDALDQLDKPESGSPEAHGPAAVTIDFNTVLHHLRRVTASGGIADAAITVSGRTFLVQSGSNVMMVPAGAKNAGGGPVVADGASAMQLTRDGSRLYFLSGGEIQSVGLMTRDRRPTPFTATLDVDLHAENRQIFDEAWWMMDRYFYDERHNGVDWNATRAKYEALLPFVPYKDDFYDLMTEMVQELRGSHVGVSGPSDYTSDSPSSTGYIGVEPDWTVLDSEGHFKIASVTVGSPADAKWSKLKAGEYLLAVDGQPLSAENIWDQLLDHKAGKKVVLTVNSQPTTEGARQVAIKPITEAASQDVEYEAWVQHERNLVDQLSGGRIAYLDVRGMDRPSELRFKEEFISQATDKAGLLVDVRYNGGGNVAHRLLDLLRKKPYVRFRPRGLGKIVDTDWFGEYLWGKPAALLINQDSASNSEMMAEGFRALGIGPLVGVPTMGAVIATGQWTFIDGGTIRTPSSGVYTASGEDFELHGRQPDFLVPYDPLAAKEGRDPQLEKAVQVLLQKLPATAATAR